MKAHIIPHPKKLIEKDVPFLPRYYQRTETLGKPPFKQMEVGDSFQMPSSQIMVLSTHFAYWNSRGGRKYLMRIMEDGMVRVWRKT